MRPFLVVAGAWLATMAASNLGTPLYAVYEQRFGFANIVLTLVFATYMLVLAPSLLAFGHLSDRFGRRPLITAGLGAATVGVALFAMASSVVWLFAARAVQGLAVGLLSGAAAAALVDLDPAPEEHRAALFAALAQAGGSSAGPLIAGLLAEWAPAPRRLCFVVLGAITAALAVAVLGLEESAPGVRRRREAAAGGDALEGAGRDAAGPGGEAPRDAASPPHAPRFQRPGVPREIRWTFVRASVTGAIVWPAAALFLSVVPSYASKLLNTHNLALLGAVAGLVLAASCVLTIATRNAGNPSRAQVIGLVLVATGLLALIAAFPLHSLPVLLAAALLTGAGHGTAFLGAQEEINRAAPAHQRGAVNAAFYTCVYVGVASSIISVGLLTLGLSLSTAVTAYAAFAAAAALAAAAWRQGSGSASSSPDAAAMTVRATPSQE